MPKLQPKAVTRVITGRDLRLIRLFNKIPTLEMAEALNLKSRKTIENWEKQRSQPSINQLIVFCAVAGFNPSRVIAEIYQRNRHDRTQRHFINLRKCVDKNKECLLNIQRIKKSTQLFQQSQRLTKTRY